MKKNFVSRQDIFFIFHDEKMENNNISLPAICASKLRKHCWFDFLKRLLLIFFYYFAQVALKKIHAYLSYFLLTPTSEKQNYTVIQRASCHLIQIQALNLTCRQKTTVHQSCRNLGTNDLERFKLLQYIIFYDWLHCVALSDPE